MTSLEAILLGVVQGLTEFLPVSSSGHLVIFQYFLNIQEASLLFETVVHLATLGAVLIFFKDKFLHITKNQLLITAVGTLPAIVFGLGAKDFIEASFSSLPFVTVNLALTGLIMCGAHYFIKRNQNKETKNFDQLTWKDGLIVGCWQALAILPGISRSGSTVFGGVANTIERNAAFQLSFYLAVPAILGASVLQILDLIQNPLPSTEPVLPYLLGGTTAFVFGMLSLRLFQYIISSAKLYYFGIYCLLLSAGLTGYLVFVK